MPLYVGSHRYGSSRNSPQLNYPPHHRTPPATISNSHSSITTDDAPSGQQYGSTSSKDRPATSHIATSPKSTSLLPCCHWPNLQPSLYANCTPKGWWAWTRYYSCCTLVGRMCQLMGSLVIVSILEGVPHLSCPGWCTCILAARCYWDLGGWFVLGDTWGIGAGTPGRMLWEEAWIVRLMWYGWGSLGGRWVICWTGKGGSCPATPPRWFYLPFSIVPPDTTFSAPLLPCQCSAFHLSIRMLFPFPIPFDQTISPSPPAALPAFRLPAYWVKWILHVLNHFSLFFRYFLSA